MNATSPSARPRRTLGFKLGLSLASTLAFLALVEVLLWAAGVEPVLASRDPFVGFSSKVPLFVESSEAGVLETAPNKRTFFNVQRFPRAKPDGTTRVFCLGGSTTYGRPYDDRTSFCGWLRALLADCDPTRRFELVNAGGISYASYRVAAVLDELTAYRPDVFVVYTGQNEFLEQRTYAGLRDQAEGARDVEALLGRTRLWAGMQQLFAAAGGRRYESNVMRQVFSDEVEAVLDTSVGPSAYHRDDDLASQVLAEYRFNLERMIDAARAAGARILLVTPASNLAACSPFKSEPDATLTPPQVAAVQAALGRANAAATPAEALEAADEGLAIDPRFAHLHYARAHALLGLGRVDEARGAFQRALDEDVCPLRAPSAFVECVREVAARRDVPLVDYVARIAELAPDGLAGAELFLDHVHPTIDAHRALGEALLDRFVELGLATPRAGFDAAAREAVAARVQASIDPSMHGKAFTNLSRVIGWAGKHDEAYQLALRGLELVPDDPEVRYLATARAFDVGRYEEALAQADIYLERHPPRARVLNVAGSALVQLGRLEEGVARFTAAVQLAPGDAAIHHNLGLAYRKLGRLDEAIDAFGAALAVEPRRAATLESLGRAYLRAGRTDEGIASLRRALAEQPYLSEARLALAQALADAGRAREAKEELERLERREPHWPRVLLELSLVLSTSADASLRDGARALELADRACELTGGEQPRPLAARAAALAELGRFDEALAAGEGALALLESAGAPERRRAELRAELERYRGGEPLRVAD